MTTPQRVAVKFLLTDPTAPVRLEPFIAIFHRFIQQGVLEGLLVDVADYSHVPNGPGIVLIGHDVDYGLDLVGGQAGLLTLRKRYRDLSTAEIVRDTLRKSLAALAAIEAEADARVSFDTGAVTIELFDRLVAPNSDEAFELRRKEIEPVADALYGAGAHHITRVHAADARKALSLRVTGDAADVATLIARLGSQLDRQTSGPTSNLTSSEPTPRQCEWEISVEDLKQLRDDSADFVLVDVREQHEADICELGGELIPLQTLPQRLGELDKSAHTVVHCRSGARSANAVNLMRQAGFTNVWNLNGGILAWIDRIDSSLTPY